MQINVSIPGEIIGWLREKAVEDDITGSLNEVLAKEIGLVLQTAHNEWQDEQQGDGPDSEEYDEEDEEDDG